MTLLNSSTGAWLATGSNRKWFSWPAVVRASCSVSWLILYLCHTSGGKGSGKNATCRISSGLPEPLPLNWSQHKVQHRNRESQPHIATRSDFTQLIYCNCTQFDQLTSTCLHVRSVRIFHSQCVWLCVVQYVHYEQFPESPPTTLPPTADTHLMECVIWFRRRHTLTLNRSSQGVCSNWIISRGLPSSVIAVTVSLISLLSW